MMKTYVKKVDERQQLPVDLVLDERILNDLEMLLIGGFSPVKGFLEMNDFCSVVEHGCLASGELWPLPVILPFSNIKNTIKNETNENLKKEEHVINLRDLMNKIIATVHVKDCYQITDLDTVGKYLLNSSDYNHPYLNYLKQFNPLYCVGGGLQLVNKIEHFDFLHLRIPPSEAKAFIALKKLKYVVGFQTRNPMHRSHFELTLKALEQVAKETNEKVSLLLTPACGETQEDDVPYYIRVRCYQKLISEYEKLKSKKNSVIGEVKLVLIPLAMRMAGPREAVLHALIRKSYGCTHFVVGRDHAGPSLKTKDGNSFFAPYAAHDYINSVKLNLGIKPILVKSIFYVKSDKSKTLEEKKSFKNQHQIETQVTKAIEPSSQESFEPVPSYNDYDSCNDNGFFVTEDEMHKYDPKLLCTISGTQLRKMLRERKPIPSWYSFPGVVKELQTFYKPLYQLGFCLYVTGLPCSGKTTLVMAVQACLRESYSEQRKIILLDADIMRKSLSKELGYDKNSRQTHVRRIGYVASLVVESGGICLVANIAPYEEDRKYNRKMITQTGGGYIEVYLSTPLEVCEGRDVKGFYAHARKDNIPSFTGINDPYEVPSKPEIVLGGVFGAANEARKVVDYLCDQGWVKK